MSALLRAAKISRVNRAHPGAFARYHRGDPGFLDGLWNGIKGAATGFLTGGPAGAILGGAAGVATSLKPKTSVATASMHPITQLQTKSLAAAAPSMPGSGPQTAVNIFGTQTLAPPPAMPMQPGNQTQSGAGSNWQTSTAAPCQTGYHKNKTGYYTKRYGWVEPGTVCVKNRKRNPLNPRAASRALGRLTSTRKAMRGIERLMNRIGGGKRTVVTASSNGRKKGCGCK